MENKEERILIIKITSDPYTCGIGGICKDKVCLKILCEMGITRQEAIEVMAKALFHYTWGDALKYNKKERETYGSLAEAALNALLEGVKK